MSATLPLWLATGLYVWQSAILMRVSPGMAIAFAGYALSNLGMIFSLTGGK